MIKTDKEYLRIDAQEGAKYRLAPGEENQSLTVINQSTEHPMILDKRSVKNPKHIEPMTAKRFVWHNTKWWHEEDWFKKVSGE
jgi:hypothetical protein